MSSRERTVVQQVERQNERGQVSRSAAQVYDAFFLPALFEQWASRVVDAAQIGPGQRILDVACGTGVLALAAAERVGPAGSVVGLDINDDMLDVARRKAPGIEWQQGKAESLPFESDGFDAVVCQFGLMFFIDQNAAIREMARVLRPGGYLVVAVWDSLANTPGYAAMANLLHELFGEWAADSLRAPFSLGEPNRLRALFSAAGIHDARIKAIQGTARFPSIESWIFTDIKGWTLADRIDDAQYARLLENAKHVLQPFEQGDGSVAFRSPAHIVIVQK